MGILLDIPHWHRRRVDAVFLEGAMEAIETGAGNGAFGG